MFKYMFKKYKSKTSPPNLDNVLIATERCERVEARHCQNWDIPRSDFENVGLQPPKEWRVYHITTQPGLLIVRNPFTWQGQRYWIKKCLSEFPIHPNKTNLDALGLLSTGEDWWSVCQQDPCRRQHLYKRLRWITLGYHHNWDSKEYNEDSKSKIPKELMQLCKICAFAIGGWEFVTEAAIVNFYHFGSTLSGHVDYSEPNKEAPIFSFSFGSRAIFLIGAERDNENNTEAILLESGDVVIMSGQSRLAVHGIPKVMPPVEPYPWNGDGCQTLSEDDEWMPFNNFVTSARINLNARQVLYPEQDSL